MWEEKRLALKPPLVGREEALRFLETFLLAASAGRGRLVLICGEAGIGKTRLAEEFEKLAAKKGFQVLVGRCIPGAPVPYLPFQEAFKKYFEKTDMGLTGFLLGKESYGSSSFDLKSESEKTLFSTLEFLKKLSAKNPLILRIEDLQWVDSASVQMLHFLARNIGGLRVLVVGTYRPEELISEVSEIAHPLLESLRIMRREAVCQEICLDILNADELKLAIEGMLEGPIDAGLLKRIVSESGGIPLFAVETVRLLFETGVLIQKGGKWCDNKKAQVLIPSTVKEVILRRLERLSKDERRIIECAAVVGEHFDTDVIEEVLKTDRLKLCEELESSERDHQLITALDGGFRFNHEIVRKVAYEQLSSTHRTELHRIIGTVLENREPDESSYGALSVHFHMAGQNEKSLKYSLLAGESCMMRSAMIEAIPYFHRALEATGNDKKYTNERRHALEGLGDADEWLCNYVSAIKYYEEFLKLSPEPKDRARVLRKCASVWTPVRLGKGSLFKAKEYLKRAEEASNIEPMERGEILSLQSLFLYWEGAYRDADKFCTEAENVFSETNEKERLALQLTDHSVIYLCQGAVMEALLKAKMALEIHSDNHSPRGEIDAAYWLGLVHFHLGDAEEALFYYDKCVEFAKKIGDYQYICWGQIDKALIYGSVGDFESARLMAMRSHECAIETESEYNCLATTSVLVHSLIHLNRIGEAEALFREVRELATSFEWNIRTFVRGFIRVVSGELFAAHKDWDRSNQEFLEGIELIKAGVLCYLFEAMARTWYGEALVEMGKTVEAKDQFQKAMDLYMELKNSSQSKRISQIMKSLV